MFGSFSEQTLSAYNDAVKRKKKESKPAWMDNAAVGDVDHSFLDNDESMAKEDYAEYFNHDFGKCLRVGQ
jgi:hypothetical protein